MERWNPEHREQKIRNGKMRNSKSGTVKRGATSWHRKTRIIFMLISIFRHAIVTQVDGLSNRY